MQVLHEGKPFFCSTQCKREYRSRLIPCKHCGKESFSEYCSEPCRVTSRRKKRPVPIQGVDKTAYKAKNSRVRLTCQFCGAERDERIGNVTRYLTRTTATKYYCSRQCRWMAKRRYVFRKLGIDPFEYLTGHCSYCCQKCKKRIEVSSRQIRRKIDKKSYFCRDCEKAERWKP